MTSARTCGPTSGLDPRDAARRGRQREPRERLEGPTKRRTAALHAEAPESRAFQPLPALLST